MGRLRGVLSQWPALALPFLFAVPGGSSAEEPRAPEIVEPTLAPAAGVPPDQELLREIELVMSWELLQEWDPEEDLPIPVEHATPEPGETADPSAPEAAEEAGP